MATEVKLPQLGQTMEEGTIVNCLVKIGDEVKKGDVIFEVETDKTTLEMESPAAGFVKHIPAQTGQTLPVGEPVLVLGEKDEDVAVPAAKEAVQTVQNSPATTHPIAPKTEIAPATVEKTQPQAAKQQDRIIASPRAKKMAKDLSVNLTGVVGSGPGGRIVENDIKKAAGSAKQTKPAETSAEPEYQLGQTIPLNRIQKITGQRMLKSKLEIPCFYLTVKVDMTNLVEFRTKFNETSDVKVAYNDFIMRSVAIGLEKFPVMTGQLDGETIKLADSIGVGLAISVPDGLVAPIIKDVNKKDVKQIASDSKAIIEKARNNKLAPSDLTGGCITVSNLGAFGIESFIPIVVPGQCSILGIGQISDTLVPDSGEMIVRKLMSMTLSVDHKVTNGAYAAQFLDFVRKKLENTSKF